MPALVTNHVCLYTWGSSGHFGVYAALGYMQVVPWFLMHLTLVLFYQSYIYYLAYLVFVSGQL